MTSRDESNDYTKDSIKAINEFFIDLIGVLVPGIIFLFSITISIVLPMIMIYLAQIGQNDNPSNYATKTDLMVSNIFQGWFWVVLFFTFLILAYAIGNIFYRLDIKMLDRAGFNYEKRRNFRNDIIPIIESTLYCKIKHKKFAEIKLIIENLLFNKMRFLNFFKFKVIIKDINNIKKEEIKKKEINRLNDGRMKFIDKYCLLLKDHLSYKDREYLNENEQSFSDILKLFKLNENISIRALNRLSYYIYCNASKNIIDEINEQLKINRAIDEKFSIFAAINNAISLINNDADTTAEKIKEKFNILKTNKDMDEKKVLKNEIDNLVKEYLTKKDDEQGRIICDFLEEPYMIKKDERKKSKSKEDEEEKEEKEKEDSYLISTGWYFLFLLRSENACDNEEDCQFPYVYYNTYLIKRKEIHLLEYTEWCQDYRSRSKNALNKLKLKIQLIAKRDYNILVKNEAHIRMSSSSWYVSKSNMMISFLSTISIFSVTCLFHTKFFPDCNFSISINSVLAILLPVFAFLLNLLIYHSAIKFIHYQRLREIFFVLQVYDEYFGKNCINRNRRKNDRTLLRELYKLNQIK
jgi:hypothetical protein